jgi:hypothetical protein
MAAAVLNRPGAMSHWSVPTEQTTHAVQWIAAPADALASNHQLIGYDTNIELHDVIGLLVG